MNRKLLLGLLALVIVGVAAWVVYPGLFRPKPDRKVLYWTDPMLPGDRSDHPGKSPMGMERTPVYADSGTESAGAQSAGAQSYYTCPMHPSVISDKPGACPVCGMALVKKTKAPGGGAAAAAADELSELKRVSLSPSQRVIANVATTRVGRSDIDKEIRTVGIVDIAEPLQAKVTARFNGRIEKLFVAYTGAAVRKGDALFELHSPDLVSAEQELLLAKAAVSEDSSGDGRQQRLLDAARERLHIHFGLTSGQIADIESQQAAHETMVFRSPISGTVLSKEIQEGDYVNEGTLLYRLADLSRVWAYLDVYEKDLPFVRVNHRVKLTTEAYPNDEFTGRVTFIDPVVDAETRTVRVRSEFPNPSGKLKPQMYVQAEIHVARGNALTIPASAVLYTGKRNIVWIEVGQNVFEPRDVRLGAQSEGSVEVLGGLHDSDLVVTSGGYLLESESQLEQPAGGSGGGQQDGPGRDSAAANKAARPRAASESGREVRITVDGSYSPDVVRAEPGVPLTLVFDRKDASKCTGEVVLKNFNVRRKLAARATTEIRIVPSRPGAYSFVCGEGMVEGTIVVAGRGGRESE